MTLKRIFEPTLAHASYLVGARGEAVVVDPNRDIDGYLSAAAEEGLRIVAVAETHIHADYASGAYELARRTGARLFVSDEGPAEWKYAYRDEDGVAAIRDEDSFEVGGLRFDVVATPGHTPEHITFVLTDPGASPEPIAAFTGDFLFVGDIGRPDLLERAAGFRGTMEAGARVLFGTIERFKGRFRDDLLIFPAHGAGSSCGKSLGNVPVSTLGHEKRSNWALKVETEAEFVAEVLAGQPEPPVYFKEMKRINKELPDFATAKLLRLPGDALLEAQLGGALVMDIRSGGEFASGAIPGTVNIPIGNDLTNWAGWYVPYDREVLLLASSEGDARKAVAQMALIGLNRVEGWSGSEALRAYERRFGTLDVTAQIDPRELARRHAAAEVEIVDVRGQSEFETAHIPGATNLFVGRLADNVDRVPRNQPVVVHCAGGVRTWVAASILKRAGLRNVIAMPGGFADWKALGLPTEIGTAPEPAATS